MHIETNAKVKHLPRQSTHVFVCGLKSAYDRGKAVHVLN
jgi:hypothetical protein